MRALQSRERKLVALGILVALAAATWLVIIDPLAGGFIARAGERDTLQTAYLRNQRILAALPVWRREAEQQKRTDGQFSVTAPTDALAAELLKTRVDKTVSEEGGSVKAIQNVDADVPRGFIRVRANLDLTFSQLYHVLGRLEKEEPYVVVDYISVAANHAYELGQVQPLDVSVEVTAAVRTVNAQ
jgi:general secretion pathway protein M